MASRHLLRARFFKDDPRVVSVVALRAIQSFEEIVRAAPQKEQYLLHQSPACAKRGYTKYRSF